MLLIFTARNQKLAENVVFCVFQNAGKEKAKCPSREQHVLWYVTIKRQRTIIKLSMVKTKTNIADYYDAITQTLFQLPQVL